jgi:hypothetical protein
MTAAACIPAPRLPRRRRRARAAARRRLLAAATLLTALAAAPLAVRAQLIDQYYPVGIPGYRSWFSDAVQDRPHGEYDALGVRSGDFVIRPALSESLGYDSNVFGAPHAAGSPLAITQGSVAASSDWSRDTLDATVGFANQQDLRYGALSHTDWNAALGGIVDIGNDHLTVAYTHVVSTTVPVQVGTLSVGQPITLSFDSARASYEISLGRISLAPAIDVSVYRFATVLSSGASVSANNRNSATGSLTASYELAPGSDLVAVASDTSSAVPSRTQGVLAPDYNDASLAAGLDYRAGTLFRYRALLGYEQRRYVNTQLSGSSGPLAELDVIWTPTRLTTLTSQVSRSLQSAVTTTAAQSFAYSTARLVVDHEYLRNVLLEAFAQLQNADYQLRNETQRVVTAGASVTWLLNRRLSLIGRFTFTQSTDNVENTLNEKDSLAELTLDFHL